MDALIGTRDFATPPETCSEQVQVFLRTSAEYLGLTPDGDGWCLAATPEMPLTGYRDHFAPSQLSGSNL